MPRRTYTDRLDLIDAADMNHIEAQTVHTFSAAAARNDAYPAGSPPRDGEMALVGTGRSRQLQFWDEAARAWQQLASS